MAITILQILALFGFLALPLIRWPKHKPVKHNGCNSVPITSKYAVNQDGEIEELTNSKGKKEDF